MCFNKYKPTALIHESSPAIKILENADSQLIGPNYFKCSVCHVNKI
jgi:hypothetical protein